MRGWIYLIVYLSVCGILFRIIWNALKAHIARVFSQNYNELVQKYGQPLMRWRWVSGYIVNQTKQGIFNMNFRLGGLIKLDIYENRLIAGVLSMGVCVAYSQYIIEREDHWLGSYLVIRGLPVYGDNNDMMSVGPLGFDKTTALKIELSNKKINQVMDLVTKSKQPELNR